MLARNPALHSSKASILTHWDVTTYADKATVTNNWKGIKLRYYKPGPFSEQESVERTWVEWVLSELTRP